MYYLSTLLLLPDGAIIDCYEGQPYFDTKRRFKINNEMIRNLSLKKVQEENVNIHKFIKQQKSSYESDRFQKEYQENRRLLVYIDFFC